MLPGAGLARHLGEHRKCKCEVKFITRSLALGSLISVQLACMADARLKGACKRVREAAAVNLQDTSPRALAR